MTTDHAVEFTRELIASSSADPHCLLQHLTGIQHQFSYIPETAAALLAEQLDLPLAIVHGVIDFYSFLHTTPRGEFDILFSDNITDRMAGSQLLVKQLCDHFDITPGGTSADGRLSVDTTSCTGMCDQGPGMLINGTAVTRLDEQRIDQIAELVEQGLPLSDWPVDFFNISDNVHRRDLLLDTDLPKGQALKSLLASDPAQVLASIESSGLRGRGGAGFKTALKWRLCAQAQADERYVVCNADEGEPGTFKDRVLLQSWADELLEGMTICAGIIGSRKGLIYLRGEYRYLLDHLNTLLQQRRDDSLLGENILGRPGFSFDVEIHLGAGAYICGEESALIESLEGRRGIPRKRPPFPVTEGYLGKPTVVNNVETFIAAAQIAVHGGSWYRSRGTAESSGTKLFSISGDCRRPGIYEYPFGVTIDTVLQDCGAEHAQAVQVAGAAGRMIPASQFNRTISHEDIATGGSFMIFNETRDMLAVAQNFNRFFIHESCGFCTPCRVGNTLLGKLVDKLLRGRASRYDIEEMRSIAELMRATSFCGLGTTAPNPVLDVLDHFPRSYEPRLDEEFEPAFDLDAAMKEAREIGGRHGHRASTEEPS